MTSLGRTTAVMVAAAMLAIAGLPLARLQPASNAQQGAEASPCLGTGLASSLPEALLLGETATVTLRASTRCAAAAAALHVVLVLDASGSMQGEPSAAMKTGAREMIAALNLPKNPTTRIAVVSFDDAAAILCVPTNDAALARGCVGRVGASGGTSIASGI